MVSVGRDPGGGGRVYTCTVSPYLALVWQFAAVTGAPTSDLFVIAYLPLVVWVGTTLEEQTKHDKFLSLAVAASRSPACCSALSFSKVVECRLLFHWFLFL